jgi:hypothetical protein
LKIWTEFPKQRDTYKHTLIVRKERGDLVGEKSETDSFLFIVCGWYWEAIEENKCQLTFIGHGDPKGSVPSWVINSVVVIQSKKFFIMKKLLENIKSE